MKINSKVFWKQHWIDVIFWTIFIITIALCLWSFVILSKQDRNQVESQFISVWAGIQQFVTVFNMALFVWKFKRDIKYVKIRNSNQEAIRNDLKTKEAIKQDAIKEKQAAYAKKKIMEAEMKEKPNDYKIIKDFFKEKYNLVITNDCIYKINKSMEEEYPNYHEIQELIMKDICFSVSITCLRELKHLMK